MSEHSSAQDRTEQATPKRRADTKKKGQVARSKDLSTALIVLSSAASIAIFAPYMSELLSNTLEHFYAFNHQDIKRGFDIVEVTWLVITALIKIITPLFLTVMVVAIFSQLAIGGFVWSTEVLKPQFNRMSPLKGIKRMFSAKSAMELVKSMLKFSFVASVSACLLYSQYDSITLLGKSLKPFDITGALSLVSWFVIGASTTLLVIAAIDVPFQIFQHLKQIKMTKQEVRDEMKETEGKPEVKSQIRRNQQEMRQQRMMVDVPKADVVLTNPSHYSVALKYDSNKGGAPVVLAKGMDHMAFQIRNIATISKVEIVRSPALSRSIYYSTDVYKEIPAGLYMAVAQVLAYVYQLKDYRRGRAEKPVLKKDLPIPSELKR